METKYQVEMRRINTNFSNLSLRHKLAELNLPASARLIAESQPYGFNACVHAHDDQANHVASTRVSMPMTTKPA
jgi:hypothetical protein